MVFNEKSSQRKEKTAEAVGNNLTYLS